MKTSLEWLREYVDIPWEEDELTRRLVFAGLEIEGQETIGKAPEGVVVGEVRSCEAHPDADKLQVCQVDPGNGEPVQVVCGAPNCYAGKKYPFAPVGSRLRDDFKVKKAKLRGVESHGMLCSEYELELGDDQSGLMALDDNVAAGTPLDACLETDTVIDWEITPNRPDWLSHIGIAREVAAVSDDYQPVAYPEAEPTPSSEPSVHEAAAVKVEEPDLCPRYTARLIRNVKIRESPEWLQDRLKRVGIRPINNVVDITNFVLMECGQPLHAFDYDLLAEHTIVVRRGNEGEKMTTLDGTEHELNTDTLVIADTEKPVALAGIMGGGNSEINENTTNVFLESAAFDAPNIRATAKRTGLTSESSYRFERGVDIEMVDFASKRATWLLQSIADGEPAEGVIDAYPTPYAWPVVNARPERIRQILGVDISLECIADCLQRVGLELRDKSDKEIKAAVPPYRLDLTREADLIEEVGRIYGLANIPASHAQVDTGTSIRDDSYTSVERVRNDFLGMGLTESMTVTLISTEEATRCTGVEDSQLMKVSNPISEEYACLRPSLIPGLLHTVQENLSHGNNDLAMFELGRVHLHDKNAPEECLQAGVALTGHSHPERYGEEAGYVYDFFDLKGILETWFDKLHIENAVCQPAEHPAFVSGQCAEFRLNDETVAIIGKAQQSLTADMRLEAPLYLGLIEPEKILSQAEDEQMFTPLAAYPSTKRDISLVAPDSLSHQEILNTIKELAPDYVESIDLFDVYQDEEALGKNMRSLAYSLTFRHPERTLKDEEVNKSHEKLKEKMSQKLSVSFR